MVTLGGKVTFVGWVGGIVAFVSLVGGIVAFVGLFGGIVAFVGWVDFAVETVVEGVVFDTEIDGDDTEVEVDETVVGWLDVEAKKICSYIKNLYVNRFSRKVLIIIIISKIHVIFIDKNPFFNVS